MKTALAFLLLALSATGLFAQNKRQDTVHFEFDKYTLKPEAKNTISALAAFAADKGEYRVTITGHTDGIGSDAYNEELAKKRVSAVKEYLMKKGIPEARIIISSYGERKPVVSNNDEVVRAANRRVEITVTYPNNERTTIITISEPEPKEEKRERDTIIYLTDGTEIEIKAGAFCDKEIKDIDFKITEAVTRGSMVMNDLAPRDADGNCLISGGMIFTSASYKGKPIQPCKDSMITIRIPAPEIFDTAMTVYQSSGTLRQADWDGHGDKTQFQWENRGDKPQQVKKNGRQYFQFVTSTFSNYNIDKKPSNPIEVAAFIVKAPATILILAPVIFVGSAIAAVPDAIQDVIAEKGLVVKSKKHPYSRSYIISGEVAAMSKGELFFKKKKARFVCDACIQGEKIYVGMFKKDGQYYLVKKPLDDLKYKRFVNRYVVRKKDYKLVTEEEVKAELAKL